MDSLVLDNFDIDVTQCNVSQYLAPTLFVESAY